MTSQATVHRGISAVVMAVLLVACGGGSAEPTTATQPTPPTSNAEARAPQSTSAQTAAAVPTPAPTAAPTPAPIATDPPTTPAPAFTPLALKPNQVFNFSGVRWTLKEVISEPAEFDADTARVTAKFIARVDAAETVDAFNMPVLMRIDGFDVPFDPETTTPFAPASNSRVEFTADIALTDLANIESAVLVMGKPDSNQAVVPLAPDSNEGAARHPEIVQSVNLTDTKPEDRTGQITVTIDRLSFGASNRSAKPSSNGSIALGIRFRSCVQRYDQGIDISVADHEGITTASHTVIYSPGTGLIVTEGGLLTGEICPTTAEFEAFTDIPVESQGKTVTVSVNAAFGNLPKFITFPVEVPVLDETVIPE